MSFDYTCGQYSADGTVFQIDYTQKCANNYNLGAATLTKDGSVAIVTKQIDNKLIIQEDYCIYKYGSNVAIMTGLIPDSRQIADMLNQIFTNNYMNFREEISLKELTIQIANQMEQYTHFGGARPFAVNVILMNKTEIYTVYPSGQWTSNYATTVGNRNNYCRQEMERAIFEGFEQNQENNEFNHLRKLKNQGGRTKTLTQQEGIQLLGNSIEQVVGYDETGIKLNGEIIVECVTIDDSGIKIWRDELLNVLKKNNQ